jgi:hypothetical protein
VWDVPLNGNSWVQLHDETLTEIQDLAIVPGDPGLVAVSPYGLSTSHRDTSGFVRWRHWSDGLPVNQRFGNAVLVDPADCSRWLVGTEGGVLVAEDWGQDWVQTSLTGRAVWTLCCALGAFWAGTDGAGIWRSEDGVEWIQVGQGEHTVFSLAECHGRLLGGTLEGVVVGDGSGVWQRMGPRVLMQVVAAHPVEPDVWMAGGQPGGLWHTENGGQTWQQSGDFHSVRAIAPPGGK